MPLVAKAAPRHAPCQGWRARRNVGEHQAVWRLRLPGLPETEKRGVGILLDQPRARRRYDGCHPSRSMRHGKRDLATGRPQQLTDDWIA